MTLAPPPASDPASTPASPSTAAAVGGGTALLAWFTGAHLINDFNALMLPAFLPAMTDEFHLSYLQLGILSLSFTILSGILQVFAGQHADRYGRRRMTIVFGFAITSVGFVGMGVSPTFAILVATSLLCGLGASTYHPQATAILVKAFPRDRGRTMGIHGWGGSVGAFIAPAGVALLVTAVGWRSALFVLAVPSVIVSVLLWRRVEESEPNPQARLRGGISSEVWLLAITFALLAIVIRGFLTFLPTFLVERGSSLSEAGLLTTFIMVVGLVAQPVGGMMFDRYGGRTVFFVASVATTASLVFFSLSSGWLLLVAIAAVAFFVFSMFPVSLAMGSELSGVERTGIGVGLIFGISGLSGAAVQPAVGAIADRSSLHTGLSVLIVGSVLAAVLSLKLPGKLAEEADDAGSVDDAGSADDASGSDDASADQAEVQTSS
ncbi:MAG: MFS transporter [Actinomycetia bacterium]|nr:MFS transporter [Actinomycetes bacterium]